VHVQKQPQAKAVQKLDVKKKRDEKLRKWAFEKMNVREMV
jgi:hypothetical protein